MEPNRKQIASSGQKAQNQCISQKVEGSSGTLEGAEPWSMHLCTHFVIQIVIALIHLVLSKIPLILDMDMRVELSRFSLGKLEGTAREHHLTEMLKYPPPHKHQARAQPLIPKGSMTQPSGHSSD